MLIVENLHYQYGAHKVLDDISMRLEAGQLGMLIGQNGAGKSTLLRCAAGWSIPEKGTVTINGVDIKEQERKFRSQVVLVPDTPDFYDELTAWEHLQFVAQLHRIPDWPPLAEELLTEFQLIDQWDTFPFTFSRGMRYKLALCLALMIRPPLILLDEPFGPLDAISSQILWRKLESYAADGNTVLFSSHIVPNDRLPGIILHLRQGHVERITPGETLNLAELLNDGEEDDES